MNAVLDRAYFDHMTGADRALQLEIIDLFRAQAGAWDEALAAAAHWRAPVHTLKGSARGIGLVTLALACEAVEAAADDAAIEPLALVRDELAAALSVLKQFAAETASR